MVTARLHNAALTTLSVPVLAIVAGDLIVNRTAFSGFSLPMLTEVGGNFVITANAELTGWNLPLLTAVSTSTGVLDIAANFQVLDNGMLPANQAQATRNQLVGYDGTTEICGNLDDAACPWAPAAQAWCGSWVPASGG